MKVPILDLRRQYDSIKKEIDSAIENVLISTSFILGPEVKKLEANIASYCGVKYGLGVANGTDALELVLKALGIGCEDEVITTPFTFFASAEVVAKLGATPVFVDVHRDTYLMDMSMLEEKITSKTKAIIPIHIFGQACDMDELMRIANKHNIYVIEDSCQAIGAEYKGNKVCSYGIAGCISFFPSKNLGGYGDGGMIVTNNEELAEKIKVLRAHGSNPKYYHKEIGYNSRLDEIQAAILNVKLKYLNGWNDLRRKHAYRYNEHLDKAVTTPEEAKYPNYHVYHQYTIEVEDRVAFETYMKEKEIGTSIYYPVPLHLQEAISYLGYKEGDMPNSEAACKRVISLPISPEMTIEEQNYVIETIKAYIEKR